MIFQFYFTFLSRVLNSLTKYSKTCVKQPLSKRLKISLQDQLPLNAGQKYCRMHPMEHSAILLTIIKLPFVIKIFVLSIFEWPFYTGFNVPQMQEKIYLPLNLYKQQIDCAYVLDQV